MLTKTTGELASLAMKTSEMQKTVLEELDAVNKEKTKRRVINFLEKQGFIVLLQKDKFEIPQQLYDAELKKCRLQEEKALIQAKISELNQLVASSKLEGRSTPGGVQNVHGVKECIGEAVAPQVHEMALGMGGAVSDPTVLKDGYLITTCLSQPSLPSQDILAPV
ncbi:uncharacterized protein LOC106173544 [Lingula anatina]|uniref:Uncharacterized protein LOC106173544 n=1 Tax=Lingula anatina TaxID=7574 RepID=A0A1S3JJ55_LINAN|nr:uncharacterized protein LOC106173544 [Lingula anatina]|eukprot:XP_013410156.1 uncharacterized protein LOC106173544 [Lingula anatina]